MDGLLRPPIPKSGISLRIRAVILLLLLLIALLGMMVLLSQKILLPSFMDLEQTQAREDTQRVLNVLDNNLMGLSVLAENYGHSNDMYQFAQDGNTDYVDSNLVNETFVTLDIDLVLIFDASNNLIYGKAYTWETGTSLILTQELIDLYLTFSPLRQYFSGMQAAENQVAGVFSMPPGLMLLATYPILTSDGTGPSRGAILMGRYLNETRIAQLAATTNQTIDVFSVDAFRLPDDVAAMRDVLTPKDPISVRIIDDNTLGGYALFYDISGKPVLLLRTTIPRDTYHEGRDTVQFFLVALAAGGLLIALGFLILLERQVLVRVLRLNTAVRAISTGDQLRLDRRVPVMGWDELATLAGSINLLLDATQKTQQSLTENQLRTQQIITSISDVLYMAQMNADGDIVRHTIPSPQVADLTGYPRSRFESDWMFWQSLILPEDRDRARASRERITQGHSLETEYRIQDANGSIHWVRDSVYFDRQPDGSAVLYGVISDITARKQAEADLAAREQTARAFQDRLKTLLRISVELAQASDMDTLLRRAIELGHSELGFERLGLWLLEDDGATMVGTYGIDPAGKLRGEHGWRRLLASVPTAIQQMLHDQKWTHVWHDAPLYDEWEVVGHGWNAMACLRVGDRVLGWFTADNLLSGTPLASYQEELLSLYGTTVAQLILRLRTGQALRESEARYAALFHRMPIELYRTTPDGKLLDANAALVELMGFDNLDAMQQSETFAYYADPADRERWQQAMERAGELHDYEVQLKRRDGSTFWARETSRIVYDENGKVLFYEGHMRDVTAQKEAEEALAAERNLLRTLIDALPDYIYAKDMAGRFLLVNAATMRLMGADSMDDLLGHTDADFYPPELATRYIADEEGVFAGTALLNRVEPAYRTASETPMWVRTTKVPLRDATGQVIGLVGVGHDITAERTTAEALRESQERLDLALQAAGLGLWDWYVQTGQVVFNERWAEISGYSLEELGEIVGVWQTLVHLDDWPEVERRLYAHFEGRTPYFEAEYRLRAKDGTVKWIPDRGKVVTREEDGTPIRMIGTLLDITERRTTERALRESQERIGLVLRGANLGSWDWAIQTDELVINDRWAEMLGYTQDEIQSDSSFWDTAVHPDDRAEVLRLQNAHLAGETPFFEAEYRLRTKGGGWCWVQSRGQVVQRDEDDLPLRMSGTHLDITARKQADAEREALLRQTRTLAAELATVAELSQQAAQILDVNALLWAVCKLVQENFGLYHVQVYLLEGDSLRLAAGAGDVGRQMVALDHAIPLDHQHSIVAEAARNRKVVVANDVTGNPTFLPNVLLPETRSEIALPMVVGDRVIGVLDVQDRIIDRFTAQDIQIQATLAAQVSIAIYNAQLFTENARRLAIIEHSQDAVALTSLNTSHYFPVYLNPAGLRILGYTTLEDITEQTLAAFYPPEVYERLHTDIMPEIRANGSWRGELTVQHSDGTLIPVEQTFFLIYDEQGRPRDLATIMTDITARKQTETALQRANRAYRVLSDCDQALIRAADQHSLLHEVCNIVVQAGGYRMAWVGFVQANDDPARVKPVARAGHDEGFLDQLLSLREQANSKRGPSCRAIEQRTPEITHDIAMTPEYGSWREAALERGYRAAISLPLMSEGRVLGTLNVYADQPGVFDSQEIALLVELADDLAYGITALHTRHERQQVLQALEQRNRELLALHDVARTLTATLDEQAIYRLLFTQVVQPLFGASSMLVATHDEPAAILRCEFVISDGDQQDPGMLPPLPLGVGPVSTVIRTGRPRIVALPTSDSAHDPPGMFIHFGDEREPRSALYVPLISGGRVTGVLNIQHYDAEAFTENDIPLLTAAANQAIVAIQNARLFAAEREQRALSEALSDIAAAVNSTLDPDVVMDRILENLRFVVPHDAASIMIVDGNVGRIVRHTGFAERGLTEAVENLHLDASDDSPTLADLRDGHSVLIADIRTSENWQHDPDLNWMRSYIGVPIMVGEQIVGVLNLDSETPGFFTEQHIERVQAFAAQVAIAIQNARLFAAETEQRALSEALSNTAAALNRTLDLNAMLEQLLIVIAGVVPHDAANIMLFEGADAVIAHHRGYERHGTAEWISGYRIPIDKLVLLGDSMADAQSHIIADTQIDLRLRDVPAESAWMRSVLSVPIRVEGEVLGLLNLDSATPQHFTEHHLRRVQAFADQAALAIRNARLFAAEREQRALSEALSDTAAAVNSTLDPDVVMDRILENLRRVVPLDSASVMLIQGHEARIVRHTGFAERGLTTFIEALRFPVAQMTKFKQMENTGRPVRLADTQAAPDWVSSSELDWIRSYIGAPIMVGARMVGVLNVDSATPEFFTQQHMESLQAFADQVAIAIQNARLFAAETEQRRFAETLREIAATINLSLDQEAVLSAMLESIRRVVPHDTATIMLIDDDVARVVGAAGYEARGLQAAVMALEFRVGDQIAMQHIIATGETLIISDVRDSDYWTPADGFEWIRSCVAAPIQTEGRVIGFLNLYSAQVEFFTTKHAERLQAFAYQASNAIHNARLFSAEHEQRALAEALRDTMAAINSSLDPDEVLAQLLRFVGRVVPHDAANIMLVQGDEATITHSRGYVERGYTEELDGWRYPLAKLPVIAQVITSSAPVLVSDTVVEPLWDVTEMREAHWIRATLKAPIQLGEDVIGILNLDSATPHAFTPEHVRQIATFAAYAATAIRNARLFSGEREQRTMAEALGNTAAVILRTLDFDEVLEHVLENLGRVLPHDAANIILIDEAGMTNVVGHRGYAERGLEAWVTGLRVPVRDIAGMWHMKESGRPVVHSDVHAMSGRVQVEQSQWVGSYIGAPIHRDNEVIGFLNVYSAQPGFFKADHTARLQSFADQAAIAIRNAQLFAGERAQRALSEGLRATAEAINRTLEFDEVLDYVLANTRHVVPHDAANIMLIEDGVARVVRGHGYDKFGVEAWLMQRRYAVEAVPDWQEMIDSGQPFVIPDTHTAEEWLGEPEIDWIRSSVKAPIRVEGRVVGILHLDSVTPGAYNRAHAERLQAFADQAAVALRNAQFFAAEHDQRTLAEALRATAEAINSTLDFDAVLERILNHVGRVVPYDVATVLLIEGDEVVLASQHAATSPPVTMLPDTQRFKLAETANMKHVFDTRAPLVIPRVHDYPGWHVVADQQWLQSQAAAPIILDDRVIGFLTLDSRTPGFYVAQHAERLQAFANQAAIAIRNSQLYAALQRQAAELEQRVGERTEELEQRRAQLQAILDAINEGVLYDEKLAVKYTNRALKLLTGYGAHEFTRYLEPLRSSRYTPQEFAELVVRIYSVVEREGFWQGHVVLRRKDGSEFDAELTVTDVRNSEGDIVGAVSVIRDISQERALQAQKDRFIASASHELRTPLTNFKTRLYLIEMQPERVTKHLEVLNQVAHNMTELVENLLDVSRFERGVISLRQRPTVLQTLIKEAVTVQRAEADAKGIALIADLHAGSLRVNADETRLRQVITNLIANAINYTQAGGTITVELRPDDAGHAVFSVRDTGIGIDPALLPQIFDPFFRANEEAAEGTGLGLTIAREIVELHGGTIHADSATGQGSTFTVKLDLLE